MGACDSLGAPGQWQEITPPGVIPGPADCTFGSQAFVIDPFDSAVIYLGTCQDGIWKSTDCGATWARIDTGANSERLFAGRQWTMAIDPVVPGVLYANSGYDVHSSSGLYKSVNGGVDWSVVWPPSDPALANVVDYGFVGGVQLDPTDHLHLLLSFHARCHAPYTDACLGESFDGGSTWHMVNGDPSWTGGEGQVVFFLDDADTWLWESQTNGMWRTTNHGDSWVHIGGSAGHGAGQLYRRPDGTFFHGTTDGILRSVDGLDWTLLPNSGGLLLGVTGYGDTMFSASGYPWGPGGGPAPYHPFRRSTDGTTWTEMDSPLLSNGGPLAYDSDHHILYSSNMYAGFWRVVTE